MQFMIETCKSLTISIGDLLITTSWDTDRFWVGSLLIHDHERFIITSVSMIDRHGAFKFLGLLPKQHTGMMMNTFHKLVVCGAQGKWLPVPVALYPAFAQFVDSKMY
jgi:hypothetical protein